MRRGIQSHESERVKDSSPRGKEPAQPEVDLSLVIPFYNEEASLQRVLNEACAVMGAITPDHEVIAVDDGSGDRTRQLICELCTIWPNLRLLAFDQNRGQAAALLDGLRSARGRILITMDGDGQNDPANIAGMLQKLETSEADLIASVRAERKDSRLRLFMSRLANLVRRNVLRDGMSDAGSALKVFRREVLSALLPIRTLYSFIPALAVAAGFRVVEMEVGHRPRAAGTSHYGLGVMLWRPLVDMIGIRWFARRRFAECAPSPDSF